MVRLNLTTIESREAFRDLVIGLCSDPLARPDGDWGYHEHPIDQLLNEYEEPASYDYPARLTTPPRARSRRSEKIVRAFVGPVEEAVQQIRALIWDNLDGRLRECFLLGELLDRLIARPRCNETSSAPPGAMTPATQSISGSMSSGPAIACPRPRASGASVTSSSRPDSRPA